eukprot:TRINITY_DN8467_c0_g1_i1.p1 TRINITY_DN8467_c0_g1~~TRINITY_DN8467_c0_g1_i1.p1  ORF type:complete len:916 (+),score=225.84 TRINITY_DN8467_c0_g1_i1:51-2798(+)
MSATDKPEDETVDVEMKDGGDDAGGDEAKAEEIEMVSADCEEAEKTGEDKELVDNEEKEEEKAKAPEKPKELEEDSVADERGKIDHSAVELSRDDSTLNVLRVNGDNHVVSSLGEGGLQYLLAGVRCTVGVKAGRYMFEFRIVETISHREPHSSNGPQPAAFLKVGFSLANSSLFSDTVDCACFDIDGNFCHQKKQTKAVGRIAKGTYTVLLNLVEESPNANTMSLFRNGNRMGKPQPLPDSLKGKTLFPTVTYRNMMIESNFGPAPRYPLPFTCRMLKDAAEDDVEIIPSSAPAEQYEVVFPIGLPDRGFFDWLDNFVKEHPNYVELSDRKIIEWAQRSGIWKPKNIGSNDEPSMQFGLPLMDNGSVKRVINNFAPLLRRNIIVGELKANLCEHDRKIQLLHFAKRHFKLVGHVIMGEPTDSFKEKVHDLILAQKKAKAEVERRRKIAEASRKKALEERKRKLEAKKKGEEIEEKEEEPEDKEEPVIEDALPVELTEEERQQTFRKFPLPDLSQKMMSKHVPHFQLPSKEEGFDEIVYEWQPEASCAEVLKAYVLEYKNSHTVDDLKPGAWFEEQNKAWIKALGEWKKKQGVWKDPAKRKAFLEKKAKESKTESAEGEETNKDDNSEKTVDVSSLDPFTVEDVADVGSGEPLFTNFQQEDWGLASIMFEIHLLLHSFKKDLNDSERPSFPESHLGHYYNRYFNKPFTPATFGFEKTAELLQILKAVVTMKENNLLAAELTDDTPPENFVKLAEDHRRDRQRRVDAGDEHARLKFSKVAGQQQAQKAQQNKPDSRDASGKGGSKGKGNQKRTWVAREAEAAPRASSRNEPRREAKQTWGKNSGGKGSPDKRQQWSRSRGGSSAAVPSNSSARIPAWNGGGNAAGPQKRWGSSQQEPSWKRPRTEYGGEKGGGMRR